MEKLKGNKLRVLVLFGVFFCLLSGLIAIFEGALSVLAKRPGNYKPETPLENASKVLEATNVRGQKIKGWFWDGTPDAGAVLLLHGHAVNHQQVGNVFPFIRKHGYNILALDFRGHGESGGEFSALGGQEWEDIDAILKKAEEEGILLKDVPLAAYGRSMGAAALANGGKHLPRINAFILESSFSKLRKIAARDVFNETGIPEIFLIDWFFDYGKFRTGIDYTLNNPIENIGGIYPKPLLIIHDGLDKRATLDQFNDLVSAASFAQTLVVPKGGHVGGAIADPELFEKEFVAFLTKSGIREAAQPFECVK